MKKQSGYWKGFASALVLVAMVAALGITAGAKSDGNTYEIRVRDGVELLINGAKFTPTNVNDEEVPVFTYNGTTYAPIRAVCEAAGMDVHYNSDTRTVVLTTPDWKLAKDPNAENYISADEAREIARKDAGLRKNEIMFLKVRLDVDDGCYDVEFYSSEREYDYEIDALTGEILDSSDDVKHFDAPGWWSDAPGQNILIKEHKARQIALHDAPKGTEVTACRLDYEDGFPVYELELTWGGRDYDCEIDALTGEILDPADWDDQEDDDREWSEDDLITEKKACQIALKKAPKGAEVVSCELDEDDAPVYELELRKGDTEYECEIDALTGRVPTWESDDD